MDPAQLKKNFEEQIATTVKQIGELEANLTKAKEYKIKLEGGLETLNLYRTLVMGVEPEPWLEIEIQEKRKKIKVRTNSKYSKKGGDYSKYANWEADQTKTDGEVNIPK